MECQKIQCLGDLDFLRNGFDQRWLDSCCVGHKAFLVDFVLPYLLSNCSEDVKTNQLSLLRLLHKTFDSIRQNKLKLETEIEHSLIDKILSFVLQRNEKIAYGGIESLDKYLKMHVECCEKCRKSDDCRHLVCVRRKFTENPGIRTKIKAGLMICLMKSSRTWKPLDYISEQYSALRVLTDRNQAVLFIINLLEKLPSDRDVHIPFLNSALSDSSTQTFVAVKERLLPQIFKRIELREWFLNNYDRICVNLDIVASLTISLLMVENEANGDLTWNQLIEEDRLACALLHKDDATRLLAFGLLCSGQTIDVPESNFKLVESFLLTNMTTPHPGDRTQIIYAFKKFLTRIAVNIQVQWRDASIDKDLLDNFRLFLSTIHNHAIDSLLTESNFNRRIMALMMLGLLHTSDIFKFSYQGSTLYVLLELDAPRDSRLLKALLKSLDYSYDLVQTLALDLIQKIDFDIDAETKERTVESMLKNVEHISVDAQHQVTFQARVVGVKFPDKIRMVFEKICSKCPKRTEDSSSSLNEITTEKPVHTFLNAFASLIPFVPFEDFEFVQYVRSNVIDFCLQVIRIFDPVLQSVSPEGEYHQAMSCWRTPKAISSIFASIVELAPDKLLLHEWRDLLPEFKDYFFTQLTVCRHKGVFELSARGFQTICDRYSKLFRLHDDENLNPLSWLKEILATIRGGTDPQRLCSTRRSAGLPHLISSILKSYQPSLINKLDSNIPLAETLSVLLDCRSLDPVFEVHCVNTLKALFQNTAFRKQIFKHLEKALLLTLNGLNSPDWSIRNAHSQLFSVLVLRIFKPENFNCVGNGTTLTLYEFSSTFPLAYEELLKLLSCFDAKREFTESIIQPILVILSRLRPSFWKIEGRNGDLLSNLHSIAFNSKRESVRNMAVESITSILDADVLFEQYGSFYSSVIHDVNRLSNNALTALFQLIGNIVERTHGAENLSKLLLNHLVETELDILSRNDFTVFHFFRAVKLSINRNASFNFRHLFLNSKLKEGQFAVSGRLIAQLYVDFYQKERISIPFNQLPLDFALHCLESVLKKGWNVDEEASSDILNMLIESKKHRKFELIRQIMDLLGNENGHLILDKLSEDDDFCNWMTEHELFLIRLNTDLLRRNQQLNADQWVQLDNISNNCTIDIALKILQFIQNLVGKFGMSGNTEKQIALFLQSEDSDIREKAASLLSPTLCPTMKDSLHSIACWALEVQKFPEILEKVRELNEQTLLIDIGLPGEAREADEEGRKIFEAIAKNTFAEAFLLSREIQAVNYLIRTAEAEL